MTLRMIKRPRAEQELVDHFVYIGQRNPDAAERCLSAAEAACARLARHPLMGRLWQFESPRLAGIRSWPIPRFRNYLIFYRPLDEGEGIEVIHVFHARRDIRGILEAEAEED